MTLMKLDRRRRRARAVGGDPRHAGQAPGRQVRRVHRRRRRGARPDRRAHQVQWTLGYTGYRMLWLSPNDTFVCMFHQFPTWKERARDYLRPYLQYNCILNQVSDNPSYRQFPQKWPSCLMTITSLRPRYSWDLSLGSHSNQISLYSLCEWQSHLLGVVFSSFVKEHLLTAAASRASHVSWDRLLCQSSVAFFYPKEFLLYAER